LLVEALFRHVCGLLSDPVRADEKNEKLRILIRGKFEEYVARAEKLKEHLAKANGTDDGKSAVGANGSERQGNSGGKKEDDGDAENKKLRAGLSSAILSERPNVSWDDVAGLTTAKEALKEAVILPIRFPQLFTGECWRGCCVIGGRLTARCRQAHAMARHSAVRAARHGQVVPGKGRRDGGEEHVLQCLELGPGVEVDGRVRKVSEKAHLAARAQR
jgi:hypothetical protein